MAGSQSADFWDQFMVSPSALQAQLSALTDRHILKRSPQSYVEQFVSSVAD
jgi:hypothetical protein